jgi:hypothetical protein
MAETGKRMQSRATHKKQHTAMTAFDIITLTGKVMLARWLRMRIKVSECELDYLMQVSAGEPTLRYLLEDVLAARR